MLGACVTSVISDEPLSPPVDVAPDGITDGGIGLTLTTGPLGVLLSPLLVALSWLAGAYFFGAAVFDAVYEQAGLGWRESLRTGWSQRSHLLGLGAVFSLLIGIPWVGPYVAALLGPVPCTTAAARLYFSPIPDKS